MKSNIQDKNKCGIYLIRNLVNGKVYIGKSNDIYRRIKDHISGLNRRSKKHENEYFINSWHKYGKDAFSYIVLEECLYDSLKDRELYWINNYESLNRDKGYNLRLDSDSGMIPLEETRKKYSEAQINRFKDSKEREKIGFRSKKFWQNNPDIKDQMALKVKRKKQVYKFFKYDKENNLLETFENLENIINKYPHYKWQNIYAVCNGYKPSIYGYIWKKEQKI